MGLIPPPFIDMVAALGLVLPEGKRRFVGSGFFYGVPSEDEAKPGEQPQYNVFLVTNRHVAENLGDEACVRLNPRDGRPRDFPMATKHPVTGWPVWISHPDPEVDVAVTAVSMRSLREIGLEVSFFQSDCHVASKKMLEKLGVMEGDGIFVLGFPLGLVKVTGAAPIVRGGTVARIRDIYATDEKTFLIDASVYPGNSGGPVVLRPEIVSMVMTQKQEVSVLMGIVRGYVPYIEEAISAQTLQTRIVFQENSGLAEVVTVDAIDETIRHLKSLQDQWRDGEPPENQTSGAPR